MDLFDYIACKISLPARPEEGDAFDFTEYEWENRQFQTKDLGNAMSEYEIREDGLWRRLVKYDDKPIEADANRDMMGSLWHFEEKSSKWEKDDFTGYVNFYDFIRDNDGVKDLWVEFRAHFVRGGLQGEIECTTWEQQGNKDRKQIESQFKKELEDRIKFINKWYFKYFLRFWNVLVMLVSRGISGAARWLSSLMLKLERWLTF